MSSQNPYPVQPGSDGPTAYRTREGGSRVVVEYPSEPVFLNAAPGARNAGLLPKLLAALAGLALLGGIIGVAMSNRAPAAAPVRIPDIQPGIALEGGNPINPAIGLPIDGNGALTDAVEAPVIIDIYSDFSCPYCANFEATYADQLMQLASDPNVSLRWHPVSVLDRTDDRTGFSTQAGAIFLEVAASQPQYVWAVNDFLLHNQQDLYGLSGDQIIEGLNQSGVSLPPMDTIMANQGPLLDQFTATFHQTGASGVPYILINGQQWNPGSQPWPNNSLLQAVANAN